MQPLRKPLKLRKPKWRLQVMTAADAFMVAGALEVTSLTVPLMKAQARRPLKTMVADAFIMRKLMRELIKSYLRTALLSAADQI